MAQSSTTQTPPQVTVELACQHLFLWVADGPRSAPWPARANLLKKSDLNLAEIQTVLQAANGYQFSVSKLTARANAIHQAIKANAIDRASAIQQLKDLDQQREQLLQEAFNQLRVDLDRDYYKLENFLNDYVKPTIRFN
jgi:hypothetical protein